MRVNSKSSPTPSASQLVENFKPFLPRLWPAYQIRKRRLRNYGQLVFRSEHQQLWMLFYSSCHSGRRHESQWDCYQVSQTEEFVRHTECVQLGVQSWQTNLGRLGQKYRAVDGQNTVPMDRMWSVNCARDPLGLELDELAFVPYFISL